MRDLTDVTLVSKDHNGPDNHTECGDLDYHDDNDDHDVMKMKKMKMKMKMLKMMVMEVGDDDG